MAARRQNPTQAPSFSSYLSLVIGLFLVVALAKWGNPIILEVGVPTRTPTDFLELVYGPWHLHCSSFSAGPVPGRTFRSCQGSIAILLNPLALLTMTSL